MLARLLSASKTIRIYVMFEGRLLRIFQAFAALCGVHLPAILLALFIGFVYAAPNLYHASTPEYQGVIMADSPDEDFYLTVINRSYALSGFLGNPYLYEYKEVRNTFQYFLVERGLGEIGSAFDLSIGALSILMKLVFPALLVLLIYFFAYSISADKLTAFFVAAAMLLGNEIVHPNGIVNLFNTFLFRGEYSEFLLYSRPVNPQVSAIVFYGALTSLFFLFRNPRSRYAIALSGLLVGGLLYVYIYFWAFAAAFLGVLFLYALVLRYRPLISAVGAAGVISLLIMAPFLYANLFMALAGEGGGLTQTIATHAPIVEKVILLPLFLYLCIFLYAWRTGGRGFLGAWTLEFSRKYVFLLLLLLVGVIVSNQQVLTGRVLFQQHFHFFTNIPMFVFSMSFLGMEALRLFSLRWRMPVAGGTILLLLWFTLGVQAASYEDHRLESARHQSLAPIAEYLSAHDPKESVVLANTYVSNRLTMYTQNPVYSAGGYDTTFQVPWERLVHNYFVTLALRGVTAEEVRAYVYEPANRHEIGYTIFTGTYWRDKCGSGGCFPDSVLEDLIGGYREFSSQPLRENIHRYKADYLLWDGLVNPEWPLESLVLGKPILQSGDFELYTLR